jgi:adenylate kinase
VIVAVTGTPGTGKTTATELLESEFDLGLDVVHLNEVIRAEGLTEGHDDERDSAVADLEALDVVLAEAVDRQGPDAVYELDATDRSPEAVAEAIAAVVRGEREPSAGTVSFIDYL